MAKRETGIKEYERNRRALLLLKVLAMGDEELRHGKRVSDAAAQRRLDRQAAKLRRGK